MSFFALLCLAIIHGLVDAYSQAVSPLWPRMESTFGLPGGGITLLFAAWMVATSISQPLFGYFGDRFGSRWLVWLAPAVAIASISAIGIAPGPISLALLLVIGGIGIGAFHPEAISAVSERSDSKSTRALAIFIAGGMLGLGLGPSISGMLVEQFGLQGIFWSFIPALGLLAIALLAARPGTRVYASPQENGYSLPEVFRGRIGASALLLLVGTFRTVPAIGIPIVLAFLFHQRGIGEGEIGRMQSIFLLAGGLGTLACPWLIRPGKERPGLFWSSIIPAVGLLLLNATHPLPYYAGLIGTGLLIQGAMPALISYAQRLLPRGRRIASSIVMGSSWGLGGLIVACLQGYFLAIDWMAGMLLAMVPFSILAGIASCFLPRLPTWYPEPAPVVVEPAGGAIVQSTAG